jgi:hypothetical protein
MPAKLGGGQGETAVPFDGTAQFRGRGLDWRAAVAGVEDQGFDIAGEVDDAVDVGFDVVVEQVLAVGLGQRDQR